jgi:hypothetical protein
VNAGGRHPNWCECRKCRADIAAFESRQFKNTVAAAAVVAVIAGIGWVAVAPLRIWHVTGPDGQMHPDGATWAAYGVSGAVILAALMFLSIRAASRRDRAAKTAASIAEALDAADELDSGWPRGDLRGAPDASWPTARRTAR